VSVRVRFAPSPTGYLHIGGARTALFNWLFARQNDGAFILRIEDTDVERSDQELVSGILEGLQWLGLDWDAGPFYQSERRALYQSTCDRLLDTGQAYRDFSPPGSTQEEYHQYRDAGPSVIEHLLEKETPFAVRFRVPTDRQVKFYDQVFGKIEVETDSIEDFVILRTGGNPTYHLSVVADDLDMRISHVIRGADHLSNTSKHILLHEALGAPVPVYAHLPLILGKDKKRLSKRHGSTSVTEYSKQGLLPDAVRNYIALLGWSPGDDSEILPGALLRDRFDISRINKANAVFDPSKLEWMNKRYLSTADAEVLAPYVRQALLDAGLWDERFDSSRNDWYLAVINLLKKRAQSLSDFPVYGEAFFTPDFQYDSAASEQYLMPLDEDAKCHLRNALTELRDTYSTLSPFDLAKTEEALRQIAADYKLKTGQFIGAVRVAVTGRAQAPGIFEVLVALGQEQTLNRLNRVLRFLE
jgi:glutamyl-tRNA synthetase